MESSKHFLGAEGCSSSESGWTMYIASPMHERDSECSGNDDGDDNNVHITNYNYCDGKDEGSDDSMASDASSGPNHQASENGQDSNGMATAPFKHDKDDNINKYSSWKKGNKQEKKKGEGGSSKKEKKDLMLRRNTTSSHTQRGARKYYNIAKYNKYEHDFTKELIGKYFSNKDMLGGNIFEKIKIGDETIKASRDDCLLSYADPAKCYAGRNIATASTAVTYAKISIRKELMN